MKLPKYLNENEVALLTGLSVQTLRNWRNQGKWLPYVKAGKAVRYLEEDIEVFMRENKIVPKISNG